LPNAHRQLAEVYYNEKGEPYTGNDLLKENGESAGGNKPLRMQLPSGRQRAGVDRKGKVTVRKNTQSGLGIAMNALMDELIHVYRTLKDHKDPTGFVLPDTYDLSVLQDGLYRSAQRVELIRESLGTTSSGIGYAPSEKKTDKSRASSGSSSSSSSSSDISGGGSNAAVRTAADDSKIDQRINELLDKPQRSVEYFRKLQEKMDATAVLIPFMRSKGQGNSVTEFRTRYLRLTIRSLKPFFKNIYGELKPFTQSSFSVQNCRYR
jgi:hypothetical protein